LLYMAYAWLRTSLRSMAQGSHRPGTGAAPHGAARPAGDRAALCPFCGLRLPEGSAARCTRCGTLFQEGEYRT